MAEVPYSSDVLCTHKTRLQLLYTDVQQLKMVQMVSHPLVSAEFGLLVWYDCPSPKNKLCEILDKISHSLLATRRTASDE